MSWRIVYITDADKISLNLNSIQIIHDGEKYFVNLTEVLFLVLEDYKTSITSRLLIELASQGIPMLVLGKNSMPIGEYNPIYDNVRASKRILEQCLWTEKTKNKLWTEMIKAKISGQINTLKSLNKLEKISLLKKNIEDIKLADSTNVEGISARIYFKELFGINFIRFDKSIDNYCLNFTYHIIRTIISKEIIARGYMPAIGINHKSQYNLFNLADDIIEVFRPIVDYYVYKILEEQEESENKLTKEIKLELIKIVYKEIKYENKKYSIANCIPKYIADIINYLELEGKYKYNYPELYNE